MQISRNAAHGIMSRHIVAWMQFSDNSYPVLEGASSTRKQDVLR